MNRTRRWLAAALLGALLPGLAGAAPKKPAVISLDQLRRDMKQRRGRVFVLHLWASWCQPCVHELPLVAELARDARARGIEVYSLSLDDPTARAAARMARVLEERGAAAINRTILRMADADAALAQIDPDWAGDIPAFFIYDRAGKLRRSHVGEMTREGFDRLVGDLVPTVVKK
jgi:thiol-disulfide isomerase/thioredoxin